MTRCIFFPIKKEKENPSKDQAPRQKGQILRSSHPIRPLNCLRPDRTVATPPYPDHSTRPTHPQLLGISWGKDVNSCRLRPFLFWLPHRTLSCSTTLPFRSSSSRFQSTHASSPPRPASAHRFRVCSAPSPV
jgi:hypothetical protein